MVGEMIMNKIVKLILILGVFLAGIGVLLHVYTAKPLILVAQGKVPVFGTVEDSMKSPEPNPVMELISQQSVEVVSCVDVKHYLVYKVRSSDGTIGYVNNGDYILLRDGKKSYC